MNPLAFKLSDWWRLINRGELRGAVLLTCVLIVCSSCKRSVGVAPSATDISGEWRCDNLPSAFLKSAGAPATAVSNLELKPNGLFTAKMFPQRSPSRLIDFTGTWTISDPSVTPSGKWSVELGGTFLEIQKRGGGLILHQSIDVLNGYSADFMRTTQP